MGKRLLVGVGLLSAAMLLPGDDSRIQINGIAPAHVAVVRLDKGALRLLAPAGQLTTVYAVIP